MAKTRGNRDRITIRTLMALFQRAGRQLAIRCITSPLCLALLTGEVFWSIGCASAPRQEMDAVSGATRPGQAVVGSVTSDYALLDRPQPRTTALDAETVFTLVRWSNNLSYGLANAAPPGTSTLLLVPTVRAEAVTDVRVLRGVALLCNEVFQQPSIAIGIPGDAQVPDAYEALVEELSGRLDLRLVLLGDESLRPLPAVTGLTRATCDLPESVALADAVILVPALWRDEEGMVHGVLDAVAALSPGPTVSDSALVDLASAVAPLYVFVDILRPYVRGETKALNAILASDDLCAVEAVGAQFLGARRAAVPGLRLAAEHEVGKAAWIDIAVNGVPIPKLKR